KRAEADIGFMFTAYNLKRIINLMGVKGFIDILESLLYPLFYSKIFIYKAIRSILKHFGVIIPNFTYQ
ncbi:MAG: hypothetical protein ABEH43_07595, partial [Flavobacteriales bacterium]